MTKKTTAPKTEPLKAAPSETWNPHWNIRRRLLEARRQLKGTVLWEQFETERSFDAFSIHKLARGIEDVMLNNGILSSFSVTRYQKNGNVTVVEGVAQFTSVDNGDTFEVATFGEGVDDSDKGVGKSLSYARKNGFIQALNLSVGIDNEASNGKAQPAATGPSMSGTPQQGSGPQHDPEAAKAAAAKYANANYPGQANGSNGHAPENTKLYPLQQQGLKAKMVLGTGLKQTCWAIISNAPTTDSLDGWIKMNEEMLVQFTADDPVNGSALQKIVQAKRETLAEKGL